MDLFQQLLTTPFTFFKDYGGPFILVLSVLVFVHEFGHYIVARWCGVKVETFSIGFGKELFGRTDRHERNPPCRRKESTQCLGHIVLPGFVVGPKPINQWAIP